MTEQYFYFSKFYFPIVARLWQLNIGLNFILLFQLRLLMFATKLFLQSCSLIVFIFLSIYSRWLGLLLPGPSWNRSPMSRKN